MRNQIKIILSLTVISLSILAINFLPWKNHTLPTKSASNFYVYKVEMINASDSQCGHEPLFSISNDLTSGLSQTEIARNLADKWLSFQKSNSACLSTKLADYNIDDLTPHSNQPKSFVVTMLFSVKPSSSASKLYWQKDNGTVTGDGWIDQKFTYLTLKEEGNLIVLDKKSTAI